MVLFIACVPVRKASEPPGHNTKALKPAHKMECSHHHCY